MSKQQATLTKLRSTLSKQHSTLLPQTTTISNDSIVKCHPFDKVECCFDIVAAFWQQCWSNIRHFRKNRSICSIRQCCFDIVAGVDGALRSLEYVENDQCGPCDTRNGLSIDRLSLALRKFKVGAIIGDVQCCYRLYDRYSLHRISVCDKSSLWTSLRLSMLHWILRYYWILQHNTA